MENNDSNTIAILFFAIFGIAFFVGLYYEMRRHGALKELAEKLGLGFEKKSTLDTLKNIENLELFNSGYARRIKNKLFSSNSQMEEMIFGYEYVSGAGRNSSKSHQTVVYFHDSDLILPHFKLNPENIFHKIGDAFGYKDIDFDEQPAFSKKYFLKGQDERAIRKVFNTLVINWCMEHSGITIECNGNSLVIYHKSKRVSVKEMQSFFNDAKMLFKMLPKHVE